MEDSLEILRALAKGLVNYLKKIPNKRLYGDKHRDYVRSVVSAYFREIRPKLLLRVKVDDLFADTDRHMQNLLELIQGQPTITKAKTLAASFMKSVSSLEVAIVTQQQEDPLTSSTIGECDSDIIKTLKEMLPEAGAAYEQALLDLVNGTRISWIGTAADLREALRMLLDKLAPDEEVIAMSDYKIEPNAKGPTMKQKVRCILKARGKSGPDRKAAEESARLVDECVGDIFRSTYTNASKFAHIGAAHEDVLKMKRYVSALLAELLLVKVI